MSQQTSTDPSITIRTYRLARDILGAKELQWQIANDWTVADLLQSIEVEHGTDPDAFLVMVNGRNIKLLDSLDTPLSDGDAVTLAIGSIDE